MATYIYDYHEERGEFHAHVTDEAGNVVWEVKYPEYLEDDESGELIEASTIFEDGYLKNADDLEGLYYYLRDWGAIEEDDVVVKKEDYEKQQPKDDLLEFTIPVIMANAIVNDEDYFLTENESEQLYNFLQNLTERYGNANLMLGDESDELGFCTRNDVDNLGGDCIRMYLKPSKKYEDGGNLPQSEYGYGTSLLAKGGSIEEKIKSRLSANFELPVEMAIYVPSTEKANQVISKRDYLKRIDDVRVFLANTFGGYSSDSIDGGYVSDEKGLIQEDVTKVTAFSTKENLENKIQSLIAQIRTWCNEWGQESIGFEFEGDMFYVDKDAKFVDGGGIPEGYHMMPDGTIMPDSAHMDKGGDVDEEEEDEEDKDEEHLEYISEETNIPIDVLKEYASNKGIEISELDTDLGYQGVYSDEEAYAEYVVDEGLMSNLSYYLEMYNIDKNITADELTDSYMDGLDDDDILSQSSYEDDVEELKEAEANLSIYEEQLEEVQSEKQDFIDSQDVEEMTESDREDMDSALEEFDKRIEELESDISEAKRDIRNYGDYDTILDKARDEVREQYYDDIIDRLNKDAVGYFVDELGYDEKDLVNKNGFFIDYAAVARDLESDYDFIEYGGEVYVFSSYYKWGGGIDLGKSFEKFKKTLNEGADEVQSQVKENEILNMAIESVGDAWENLTDAERSLVVKGFREGYNKSNYAKGGQIDPTYTHFAVRKSDGKIVTGWEYNDVDKQSIKYYTTMDLKDMDFKPSEFRILTSKFLKAKGIDPFDVKNWWNPSYDLGGSVEEGNLLMLKNQAREFEHHAQELQKVVEKNPRVDAWVVAKAERASSDLSDITHYLEGQVEMDDEPSSFDNGGTIPKVFEKVKITIRDVDMGGEVIYKNDHWINKKALDEKSTNDIGLYIMRKYGIDYGNTYKFSINRSGETREKYNDGGDLDFMKDFEKNFTAAYVAQTYADIQKRKENQEESSVESIIEEPTEKKKRGWFNFAQGGDVKTDEELKQIMPNIDTSKKKLDEISAREKKQVASKIDELVTMVNEAKEKGEKPKYFNLCDISVPGTNIYCDNNLGIDRNDMPQFKGSARPNSLADQLPKDPKSNEVDTEEFFKLMLNKRGIEVNGGDNDEGIEVEPDVLKATQMNMVGDKVAGMYGALEKDPTNRALTAPIYVSNDGYVLDGHHRWAAIVTYNAKNPNNPIPMKVRIIDLPIKPLVRLANDFADSIGIEKKAAVAGQMAKGGQVSLGDWEFDEHGWAYSYGKLKGKNRSFGFMVSVDPNEKASVSWDSPYMQNATWDKKVIDEVRKDMPISNKMARGGELEKGDIYRAVGNKWGVFLRKPSKKIQSLLNVNSKTTKKELKELLPIILDVSDPLYDYVKPDSISGDFGIDPFEYHLILSKSLSEMGILKSQDEIDEEQWDRKYKSGELSYSWQNDFQGISYKKKDNERYLLGTPLFRPNGKEIKNPTINDVIEIAKVTKDGKFVYLNSKYEGKKWVKNFLQKLKETGRLKYGGEMAKGGVLSDVDMYVKIHGYYPEEVMALRGDGMGLGIIKNEAHRFELSSEDSRKAEEMGYEFDYYDAKGWVEKEDDDDDFAKGGKTKWIQEAISKPGALRETAKRKGLIKGDEKLSKTDLKKLEKVGGKTGQRARLAETLKGLGKKKKMAQGGETKFINLNTLKGQSEVEKYLQKGWSVKYQGDKFAILERGGKKKMIKGGATFDDKVKAISKNLKGRKVPKKLQKDYGKTYDTKQERDDAARRIAGAMRAEEMGTRKK
jgi:hypothetical protein